MTFNSKQRFSSKAQNYLKYRPHYPAATVLDVLRRECGLTPASVVADIGSGTGFSTEIFLGNGNATYGIEPNAEMRAAGEGYLAEYAGFTSIAADAEHTTLPDASVDFVVAGQAFHWFDHRLARAEFERILRPGGWMVLLYNDWQSLPDPFNQGYVALVERFGKDYKEVNRTNFEDDDLAAWYGPAGCRKVTFRNPQRMDRDGLRGRLLSSSYMPGPGEPGHREMLAELDSLFDAHQVDGYVDFDYMTALYYGQLS